jgi:hypothetical protein
MPSNLTNTKHFLMVFIGEFKRGGKIETKGKSSFDHWGSPGDWKSSCPASGSKWR